MRNISTAFRKLLHSDKRDYLAYADVTLTDETVLHFTNEQIWDGGFTVEQAVSDDNSFTALGSVIIGSATLVINNIYDEYSEYDFTNATVVMSISLPLGNNEIEPPIKLGTYRVDDAIYNGSTITLSMLDYMEQFDRPYAVSTEFGTNGAKLLVILEDVCEACGVTLNTLNFPHIDFRVPEPIIKDGVTCREVVSWVAQIAGCFTLCNANGQLELKWFNTDALITDDLDGGIFDPKTTYSDGTDIDGGTFLPWNTGDALDGGSFVDYSQEDVDGGTLQAAGAYPSGDTANGGKFNPWSEEQDYDGGLFNETRLFHYLYSISSQNICVDDTVITGVSIVIENEEKPDDGDIGTSTPRTVNGNRFITEVQENYTIHTLGEEGYIISIENNGFINNDNALGDNDDGILFWLGAQLIGLTFRKMSINMLNDPSIEAGDVARVLGRRTDEYDILVTRSTFTVGGYQTIVCGSDTPLRNSATRFSEATKNYLKSKKQLRKEQDERDQIYEELTDAINSKSGLYYDPELVPGGGTIHYLHDKPDLDDSDIVWKVTADAFAVTTQWNKDDPSQTVWNAGLTASGDAIAHRLAVTGLTAEWITVGLLRSPLIDPSNPNSGRNFTLDLDGTLTLRKGDIRLGYNSTTQSYAFTVNNNGDLVATNADISGKISATSGTIGSFTISNTSIYNDVITLNTSGLTMKKDNVLIGHIGTNSMQSHPTQRGIDFDLEYTGNYMSWASEDTLNAGVYTMKMTYVGLGRTVSGFTSDRLTFGCDLDGKDHVAYNLFLDPNTGGANGGVTGTLNFVQILSMDSDGTAYQWQNYAKMVFKNGLLVDSFWN